MLLFILYTYLYFSKIKKTTSTQSNNFIIDYREKKTYKSKEFLKYNVNNFELNNNIIIIIFDLLSEFNNYKKKTRIY